jgi:hypothetical protein
MAIGHKKPQMNRIGLKKVVHRVTGIGLKASDIALAASPVAAMAGLEPAAAALEAGGAAGKAVFTLASKIV